jgi:hypothetical protein
MTINDLPAIMGALLVVSGIAQVFVQMFREPAAYKRRQHQQGAHLGADGFKVQSAYPGMVMVCFGTLLLIAGHFFGR